LLPSDEHPQTLLGALSPTGVGESGDGMTETGDSALRRRFARFSDPTGRSFPSWVIAVVILTMNVVRGFSGDLSRDWLFWLNVVLLVVAAVCLVLTLRGWWRHRNTPAPDECPACGHEWMQHSVSIDVASERQPGFTWTGPAERMRVVTVETETAQVEWAVPEAQFDWAVNVVAG
jgi:hypothetical protein